MGINVLVRLPDCCSTYLKNEKVMKIGILAFGSLINNPGDELNKFIIKRIDNIETPFKIEYGRKSSKRGNAPTLIPVKSGGHKVNATLLVLSDSITLIEVKNMLYRREINIVGSKSEYTEKESPTVNQLVIEEYKNFKSIDVVLTAKYGCNLPEITPEILADYAIESYNSLEVEEGRDGISYLYNNLQNGILTPLTSDYERLILEKMNSKSLKEIIEK